MFRFIFAYQIITLSADNNFCLHLASGLLTKIITLTAEAKIINQMTIVFCSRFVIIYDIVYPVLITGIIIGIIIGHFEHQTLLKCKMTCKMRCFWRSFYTFFFTLFLFNFKSWIFVNWKPQWPSKVLATLGGGGVPILKKLIRTKTYFFSNNKNWQSLWEGPKSLLIPLDPSKSLSIPLKIFLPHFWTCSFRWDRYKLFECVHVWIKFLGINMNTHSNNDDYY